MTSSLPTTANNLSTLYEQDYYLWLETTVRLLREGQLSALDVANLLEEIEDMGRSEKRAVYSNLKILLIHLLKYNYQSEKRSNSWLASIVEHRQRLRQAFKESPSLQPYFTEIFDECYQDARELAAAETGLEIESFPVETPFTPEEALDSGYLPD
ncbi:DUF29 domain-containing protein [Trichocoleus sp. FACHB-90]|uniref:DUF29 domain-containing protein n=1 Tax=Cyanophyceae TaxID=3028117 RepID=UPI0016883EBD|nr:DUF29 domain-containing protein [Trichocoleus sp. FACHB-90]MBD1927102.1 DUF29 domain-containing protein [Trichocoleus sp. FACHB-90]